MRLIWAIVATLLAPALRLHLRRRAARGREDPARLAERRGVDATPRPPGRLLWLHAASVGEAVSVLPVLAALPAERHVLFTTGTRTSAAMLAERLPALGLAPRVTHRFVPLDVPAWAARFLDHWRPDAAAFVESEIWPNLIAACRARGIPLALVNARLSERSFRWWRRVPGARGLFGGFAWIAAQSAADAARLAALGGRATAEGNLKYAAPDLPADPDEARLRALIGPRPVFLAASTHEGEERLIAGLHARLAAAHPGLLTIIVPRHATRGAEIAALGDAPFPRHSLGQDPPPGGIWVGDTMGRMGLYYRLARVVFVGKSLLPPGGGQNPLEPARLGCAVAMGPHLANFRDMATDLRAAGALTVVPDAAGLEAWADAMLRDPGRHAALPAADAALPARIAARLAAL